MFNIESLALKDTTVVPLKHPVTDELLFADKEQEAPVQIHLYGTSSKQYRNVVAGMQARALKRGNKKLTVEEMKKEGIDLLVACSDKIDNLLYEKTPVDNPEAFRALYEDPRFSWLKDQVDAALGDISAFLEA